MYRGIDCLRQACKRGLFRNGAKNGGISVEQVAVAVWYRLCTEEKPVRLGLRLLLLYILTELLLLRLVLLAKRLLWSEQESTLSIDVKVVNVLATVRNKQGEIIRDLTKDDFTLEEDGRPQTIRYFSRETDLSLTLGLLVDTSLSQRRLLGQERSARPAARK